MKSYAWQAMAFFVVVVAVLAPAAAQEQSEGQKSLPEMISSATTAADHEKIATYYDAAAKDAKERAEEHSKSMQAYKSLGGGLVGKLQLEKHCASLTQSAQSESKDYESLANAHREMAQSATK